MLLLPIIVLAAGGDRGGDRCACPPALMPVSRTRDEIGVQRERGSIRVRRFAPVEGKALGDVAASAAEIPVGGPDERFAEGFVNAYRLRCRIGSPWRA